jgi:hypothetical protein
MIGMQQPRRGATVADSAERKEALKAFQKERRLLLIVAAVLLAHQLLGVTVERSAETLGIKIEFQSDHDIAIIAAAGWAWVFVRYWQCLYTREPEFPTEIGDRVGWKSRRRFLDRQLRRIWMKDLLENHPETIRQRVTIEIQDKDDETFRVTQEWLDPAAKVPPGRRFSHSSAHTEKAPGVPGWVRASIHLWSRVWAIGATSYGTDYIFPGVLGALPAFIAAGRLAVQALR